ncbi:MAG: leucine--tRNA ligase [Candidatus Spechtbacteria bacterium SB0662_bin_43]|uniref:Leucine--tRNA ligase n=1 Tax=Candidatus Spechtbacteria bacterium SB0662_bin_43 TaxID=2604897 RepID=A0A845D9P1_9BACT|nr:leucine--tRNA ligase [Candidatus Spechtbacteria bacterium SB0662_bin_43]
MERYNPKKIEKKWQDRWEKEGAFGVRDESKKPKYYVLDMFPYPSGQGLHMGHIENFTATDILARYKRMCGFSVLHPMGWDAFGLPAENYAIKTGIPPQETTSTAIHNFRRQIQAMGLSYDWEREVGTQTPEYYRWTQWLFLVLYKNGLAYKKEAKVNWDPVDNTVLANEQVLPDGTAERSGAKVIQKDLEQWFFKITDFVQELVCDLDTVDWPQSTVQNQRNWIGRSEGSEIEFEFDGFDGGVRVFTTRADTLMGATYIVFSPEHPQLQEIKNKIKNWKEVESYIQEARNKTDRDRISEKGEKTGVVLDGVSVKHPLKDETLPVFVADFVLSHYGTGAIMAVPAHDERDWEFATKYGLNINRVIVPEDGSVISPDTPYLTEGVLTYSGEFDGMTSAEAKEAITKKAKGALKVSYRLRDWLISRQRYWGCPIPIVYDPDGNPHPIPDEHLPWLLPDDVEFVPHGTSPLAQSKELQERTERIFGKGYRCEVDTMDTFVDSSWYFFRFLDPHNDTEFADKQRIAHWMPVDLYMGGAEHTVLHLLYARFFTKALQTLGYLDFGEPFAKLRHQGIVLGEDHNKMSKSKGNIVNPDVVVDAYGADTTRMYTMFLGALEDTKPWNSENIIGVHRFLGRVWGVVDVFLSQKDAQQTVGDDVLRVQHRAIKKVRNDIESLRYNTAISALMEYVNVLLKHPYSVEQVRVLLVLLAPFAPHITEELWERIGEKESIHSQPFCKYDESYLVFDSATIVVQVNGKVRGTITMPLDADKEATQQEAIKHSNVKKYLENKKDIDTIFVPNTLINFVF